ncbi:MAG: ATP-binding protein [Aquificaceae bacterium]
MKLFLAFFFFLFVFIAINIAFLDNLRTIWPIGYPLVLLVINLDLLVLIIALIVFFRKAIKTYLSQKGKLRKKLTTMISFYVVVPLIFLQIATAIVLLQSTKTMVSSQLRYISESTNALIQKIDKNHPGWQEALKAHQTALNLRAMVKARDIISGVYLQFVVLLAFISFISAIWLGNLIARHISIPIEKLTLRARELSRGNFDTILEPAKTSDEIQELSESFINMKQELKRLYEKIEKERAILKMVFDALPIGIRYSSLDGQTLENNTFKKLSLKPNVHVQKTQIESAQIEIYEDLEPILLAERFRTWQYAVKRIAHEIKNPLTPIRLNLEKLMQREELKDIIKHLIEEVERIAKTTSQFSQLSDNIDIKPEDVNLETFLKEFSVLYPEITLKVIGEANIKADRKLLKDLFLNLLNNSVEWGAKNVSVKLSAREIVYKDDGKGIEEGEEELIFEPYYSKKQSGMGLGLAIVRHIANLHGWETKAFASHSGFHLEFKLR